MKRLLLAVAACAGAPRATTPPSNSTTKVVVPPAGHDYTPDEAPPMSAIYFHPSAASSPIPIARTLDHTPRIDAIDDRHPVLRDLSLADATFGSLDVFAPRGDRAETSLASSGGATVIAARVEDARKLLVFGFSLRDTDLVLRTAVPLLVLNALRWEGATCSSST